MVNNTFADVSCGGIYLGQVNDVNLTDASRLNAYFRVDNNFFDGIPSEYHDCSVILGGYLTGEGVEWRQVHVRTRARTHISLCTYVCSRNIR